MPRLVQAQRPFASLASFLGSFFSSGERVLFSILVLVHVLPVWAFRYFPTTDGPAHLYNAWLWKTLALNASHPFHHYLAFNFQPEPNYLSHVLLAGALTVLPPWLADKVVLTLYVAGLPIALRYWLRSWQPAAKFLAVLGLPFVYSMVFQFGFYNFCLSLVLLLVVLGYWRRHLYTSRWAPCRVAGLAGWLTLLYFSHPLTYLVAGLVLGLMVLERALVLTASGRRTWSGGRLVDGLASLALACFPTLPLLIWYLWHQQPEADAPTVAATLNTWQRLNDWLLLEPLRFMGSAEATYRLILAVLLGGLLGYAGWQHLRRQAVAVAGAWAVAIIGLAVAYIWMPDAITGGSIVRPRLALCSYLLVLGLLSTVPYPRRLQQFILGVGGLLAVLLLGFRYSHYRTLATGIDEYRSAAPYLRPGATLAALTYGNVTHMPNGKTYDSYINPFPTPRGT